MSYDLRYRSSRSEIWRWYWNAWRARLWRTHLGAAAVLALLLPNAFDKPLSIGLYAVCFAVLMPVVTLVLAAVPQILFKGKERTLQVGPAGWSTRIGHMHGNRAWTDIASVKIEAGSVVITGKSGNTLVIPSRALPNPQAWQQFQRDAQAWHQEHAV